MWFFFLGVCAIYPECNVHKPFLSPSVVISHLPPRTYILCSGLWALKSPLCLFLGLLELFLPSSCVGTLSDRPPFYRFTNGCFAILTRASQIQPLGRSSSGRRPSRHLVPRPAHTMPGRGNSGEAHLTGNCSVTVVTQVFSPDFGRMRGTAGGPSHYFADFGHVKKCQKKCQKIIFFQFFFRLQMRSNGLQMV